MEKQRILGSQKVGKKRKPRMPEFPNHPRNVIPVIRDYAGDVVGRLGGKNAEEAKPSGKDWARVLLVFAALGIVAIMGFELFNRNGIYYGWPLTLFFVGLVVIFGTIIRIRPLWVSFSRVLEHILSR